MVRMADIIDTKRDGGVLSDEQSQLFVDGVVNGTIPDYQTSALLMIIYFQDMAEEEQTSLTMKMMEPGERLDLSRIPGIKVDKHSTGGVGDKVSLPLAAMAAATGIPVPMTSGRGPGHAGGMFDELEAVPGFRVELSEGEFINQVAKEKLTIVDAAGEVAPADKKIYRLRGVTDTVDSIPLVASSIMNKKIASGTDALVIDTKTGTGTFMKTLDQPRLLAKALVEIGKQAGLKCMAVISDMNQSLGNKIGNVLEIEELIDVLKRKGPKDFTELVLALGSYMVVMGEEVQNATEVRKMLEQTTQEGPALERFAVMIGAQGGDLAVVDNYQLVPQAKRKIPFKTDRDGVLTELSVDEVGTASMLLGGGRQKADDAFDYSVGIELHYKLGNHVKDGEPTLTIYSNRQETSDVEQLLKESIKISDDGKIPTLIHEIIE